MNWPVVPISPGQALDVRQDDLVANGHFRLCETYRGGGGYDRFPQIAERRGLGAGHHRQFIVQLRGCNLDCPYCYVTREGVWNDPVRYSTEDLVREFNGTNATVFHLMGGAPALYLNTWPDLIQELHWSGKSNCVFHSDLLLTEAPYSPQILDLISIHRALYAVDVKGLTEEEHQRNTRKPFSWMRFVSNLALLEDQNVSYYITFTNVRESGISAFWSMFAALFPDSYELQKRDAFSIDLIDYKALIHVDDVPWGKRIVSY